MKVSITLTDAPTPSTPKAVACDIVLDPPIEDYLTAISTPASELAGCAVMAVEYYAEKLRLDTSIAAPGFPVPEVLGSREISTILAALRLLQRAYLLPEDIAVISVGDRGDGNGARDISMDSAGIDELYEKLSMGRNKIPRRKLDATVGQ